MKLNNKYIPYNKRIYIIPDVDKTVDWVKSIEFQTIQNPNEAENMSTYNVTMNNLYEKIKKKSQILLNFIYIMLLTAIFTCEISSINRSRAPLVGCL